MDAIFQETFDGKRRTRPNPMFTEVNLPRHELMEPFRGLKKRVLHRERSPLSRGRHSRESRWFSAACHAPRLSGTWHAPEYTCVVRAGGQPRKGQRSVILFCAELVGPRYLGGSRGHGGQPCENSGHRRMAGKPLSDGPRQTPNASLEKRP